MPAFNRKKRIAEVEVMAPKLTKDGLPAAPFVLISEKPAEPYNRFVEDGYGLIIDDSEAEGEPLDFSPWVEGENE